jgi:ABC-type Fe3+-siderophore transport system permease subunit
MAIKAITILILSILLAACGASIDVALSNIQEQSSANHKLTNVITQSTLQRNQISLHRFFQTVSMDKETTQSITSTVTHSVSQSNNHDVTFFIIAFIGAYLHWVFFGHRSNRQHKTSTQKYSF